LKFGAEWTGVERNVRFPAEKMGLAIGPYLGNGDRYGQGYY